MTQKQTPLEETCINIGKAVKESNKWFNATYLPFFIQFGKAMEQASTTIRDNLEAARLKERNK